MSTDSRLIGLIALSLLASPAMIGHAEGGGGVIQVGDAFVDFELEAHDGTMLSSADLEGRPYLLFFYPKAGTPG